jgi:hypothetical protein
MFTLVIHILFFALVVFLGRVGLLWLRPTRECLWCAGAGRRRTLLLRRSRRCWRCDGEGETWRYGAGLVRDVHIAARNAWLEWRYRE